MRFEGIDAVFARVNRLQERLEDVQTPMAHSGDFLQQSIVGNINAGGRPTVPLAASTIRGRLRRGNASTQPLVDTGSMRDSAQVLFEGNAIEVGTDKVQAARLNFGYPGGSGRGHSPTPSRPFMFFRTGEVDGIGQIFTEHLKS